jgi:hypothetical protein
MADAQHWSTQRYCIHIASVSPQCSQLTNACVLGATKDKKVSPNILLRPIYSKIETLQSVSAHTDLRVFLQSRIDQTLQVLSHIYGGHGMLDMVSDLDGSHQVDPEGLLLCCFD